MRYAGTEARQHNQYLSQHLSVEDISAAIDVACVAERPFDVVYSAPLAEPLRADLLRPLAADASIPTPGA